MRQFGGRRRSQSMSIDLPDHLCNQHCIRSSMGARYFFVNAICPGLTMTEMIQDIAAGEAIDIDRGLIVH